MSFKQPLKLEYVDGSKWIVDALFSFLDNAGELIEVPKGTVTDFASIPRFFWRILPPTGLYGKAAVIHDWLYQLCGNLGGRVFDRKRCDEIFLEAMIALGVPTWKRQLMYRAVRMFGWTAWNGHAKRILATGKNAVLKITLIATIALSKFFLAALIALAGCATRTVEYQGIKYSTRDFLTQKSVGKISIQLPEGVSVDVENFSSDQTHAAGAIAEGVARGLKPK